MDIHSAFPSNYLRAVDIQGRRFKAVIDHVKAEKLGEDMRPVLYCRGATKGIALNKTNAMAIAALFGSETDDWTGGTVEISTAKVMYQGKMVDGITVMPVPSAPAVPSAPVAPTVHRQAPAAPASTPLAPGHALDDDIPFSPSR